LKVLLYPFKKCFTSKYTSLNNFQVRNYSKVKAKFVDINFESEKKQKYIYFETKLKESDQAISLILPINEYDYPDGGINMLRIEEILKEINQQENQHSTNITLGIVSTDSTTVYYNLSFKHQM
jgi:hypothetical protein